jgi:hypothetical protein
MAASSDAIMESLFIKKISYERYFGTIAENQYQLSYSKTLIVLKTRSRFWSNSYIPRRLQLSSPGEKACAAEALFRYLPKIGRQFPGRPSKSSRLLQ